MRILHSWSLELLLLCVIMCTLIPLTDASATQRKQEEQDWVEIVRLHDRGWTELDKQNSKASERTFRLASNRLKTFRDAYAKDRSSIRFLRATYRLGYFAELGNNDVEAKELYGECLAHKLLDSPEAVADGAPISRKAKERLEFVKRRLGKSTDNSKEGYPRITARGGSKGGEKNLPALSFDLRP